MDNQLQQTDTKTPLFVSSYWKDELVVYPTYLTYKKLFGEKRLILIDKIADVSKPFMALTGVNISLISGETLKLSMRQERINEFMELMGRLRSISS